MNIGRDGKTKKNPSNESLFVSICRFDRVYQRWIIKYHKDGIKKNVKKPDVEFSEANKTTTKTKNEKRKTKTDTFTDVKEDNRLLSVFKS